MYVSGQSVTDHSTIQTSGVECESRTPVGGGERRGGGGVDTTYAKHLSPSLGVLTTPTRRLFYFPFRKLRVLSSFSNRTPYTRWRLTSTRSNTFGDSDITVGAATVDPRRRAAVGVGSHRNNNNNNNSNNNIHFRRVSVVRRRRHCSKRSARTPRRIDYTAAAADVRTYVRTYCCVYARPMGVGERTRTRGYPTEKQNKLVFPPWP